ncbi:hypothetical protein SS05631_c09090 [Sinorhizobium sp. CCBAU 05631]|nr:hypothetical protein SS05631_c09090 [Sinorhizobium sp. CCBAU 05631]
MRTDRVADRPFCSDGGRNVHAFSIWHPKEGSKSHSPSIETIDRSHRRLL